MLLSLNLKSNLVHKPHQLNSDRNNIKQFFRSFSVIYDTSKIFFYIKNNSEEPRNVEAVISLKGCDPFVIGKVTDYPIFPCTLTYDSTTSYSLSEQKAVIKGIIYFTETLKKRNLPDVKKEDEGLTDLGALNLLKNDRANLASTLSNFNFSSNIPVTHNNINFLTLSKNTRKATGLEIFIFLQIFLASKS